PPAIRIRAKQRSCRRPRLSSLHSANVHRPRSTPYFVRTFPSLPTAPAQQVPSDTPVSVAPEFPRTRRPCLESPYYSECPLAHPGWLPPRYSRDRRSRPALPSAHSSPPRSCLISPSELPKPR